MQKFIDPVDWPKLKELVKQYRELWDRIDRVRQGYSTDPNPDARAERYDHEIRLLKESDALGFRILDILAGRQTGLNATPFDAPPGTMRFTRTVNHAPPIFMKNLHEMIGEAGVQKPVLDQWPKRIAAKIEVTRGHLDPAKIPDALILKG